MRGLSGKVAVVAGAGGIGSAVAARLADEGVAVVLADLDMDSARRGADGIQARGGVAVALHLDLSDDRSVAQLYSTVRRELGRVDLLYANGADLSPGSYGRDTDLVEAPLELFDHTMSVNLRGHLLGTRAAIPLMLEHGGGSIVYTSSLAAFVGNQRAFYSMSKAALSALARSVAHGWGRRGIRANVVAPGFVPTDAALAVAASGAVASAQEGALTPVAAVPSDIADTVTYLLSDEASAVQGQVLHVNCGSYMN